MKKYSAFVKGIMMVGQFGFMLVTPPLCMALLANWLMKKFNLGIWIMILFILIGILTSFSTAADFFKSSSKKAKASSEDMPISFRNHI